MQYKRLEGETDDELILRICRDKEEIGTWRDVADVLNNLLGTNYGESKFRKSFQSFEKLQKAHEDMYESDEEYLNSLKEQEEKIRQERIKNQTIVVERGRYDREKARKELFFENIGKYIKDNPLQVHKHEHKSFVQDKNKKYVLAFGDLHYGAEISVDNNTYSMDIADERIDKMLDKTIDYVQNNHVSNIVVLDGGDIIHGAIHLSVLMANESSVVEALVRVSRKIASFLNDLSEYVTVDYYPVQHANHSELRFQSSKAGELADEDLQYVYNNYIADLLSANNRVSVHIPNGKDSNFVKVDALKPMTVYIGHGDNIKNINSALKDLTMQKHEFIDVLFLAHFHSSKTFTTNASTIGDCETIIIPSMMGVDEYAQKIMLSSRPSALLCSFDTSNGDCGINKMILS